MNDDIGKSENINDERGYNIEIDKHANRRKESTRVRRKKSFIVAMQTDS